jgi:hypothetical protein
MNDPLQLLRKVLLFVNALVFLGFAISTTVDIDFTAAVYALGLDGISGHNEFRAVFMGFWLGLTVLFIQAIRHYRLAIVGDLAFMLILFQSLARVYSFAVDGIPRFEFIAFFVMEFTSAVIGLLIRPHGTPLHWVEPSPTTRPSSLWRPSRPD